MKTLQALLVMTILTSAVATQFAIAEDDTVQPPSSAPSSEHITSAKVPEKTSEKMNVKETIDTIKSYSVEKRDEALKKAKAALDDFDARMEKLEKKIEESHAKWSMAIMQDKKKMLEELKKERKEVAKLYEDLKTSSKKAWENTKDAFIKMYEKLESKFENTDKAALETGEK